ncbi:MAG: pyridoxamine 5'-phosphate oxidase family protein [Acidimicrobiales bacterium]|nr:pyridoxamine 5'-phosphate oxidase family protein [Acidimicrobiales bacterium]
MDFDANGLEIIDRSECLRLLATVPIGRIGLSVNALPVVLPVNFVLRDEEIIIRTAPGTKLSAALAKAVVAFEADHFDAMSHTGWSVLVQGTSRVLRDQAEIEAARRLPLRPWANEATDWFIAVSTELVNGRRVRSWNRPSAHTAFVHVAGNRHDGDGSLWRSH